MRLAYDIERVIEIEVEPGVIEVRVIREIWYRVSADGGITWSEAYRFTTDASDSNSDYNSIMFQAANGKLWAVWVSNRTGNADLWCKTSVDGGGIWSADTQLTTNSANDDAPTITQAADGRLVVAWNRRDGVLLQRSSTDGGATWSVERQIAGCCRKDPSLATVGGVLWLAYEQNEDIWYRTSTDQGGTWSAAMQFTRFIKSDAGVTLAALASGEPGLVWQSIRSGNQDIWFGKSGDYDPAPPYIESVEHRPQCNLDSNTTITFRARALDETGVASVHLVWTLAGEAQTDLAMYDDGMHGDEVAGDDVWTVQHEALPAGSQVTYTVCATDTDGNRYCYPGQNSFTVQPTFAKTTEILLVPDAGGNDTSWFRTYYARALEAQGYKYDTWDTSLRCAPDSTTLNQYAGGTVIWAVPYEGYITNDSNQRTAVQSYLEAGGKLFITGQNIARYLTWYGGAGFLNNYLHATYQQDDTGLYAVTGVPGDPIGDKLALNISGGDGAKNQYSKDGIDPVGDAQAIFTYRAGAMLAEPTRPAEALPGGPPNALRQSLPDARLQPAVTPTAATPASPAASATVAPEPTKAPEPTAVPTIPPEPAACIAGLRVDTGTYKVVYFAFGFEAINNAAYRAGVMERVLAWLERMPPWPVQLTPAYGQAVQAGDVNFTWLGAPGATSYNIQIDTVCTFDSPDLIDKSVDSTSYNRSFATLGAHCWRVRAKLDGTWGDWTAAWPFSIAAGVTQVTMDPADDTSPALAQTADGKLLTVFVRNGNLWSRASTDGGAIWAAETQIAGCCRYRPSLARAADGTLWLVYDSDHDIWYRTSADNGATWAAEKQLTTDPSGDYDPVVFQAADGKLWVVWQSSSPNYCSAIRYKTSANGGVTWSAASQLTRDGYCSYAPAATAAADGRLVVVWNWDAGLWQRTSADGGVSWSKERQITDWGRSTPSLATVGKDLWLVYEKDGDIWYRTSADQGDNWSEETRFTRFVGGDNAPAGLTGRAGIAWQSDRSGNPDIWFGSPGERMDLNPPPYVEWIAHQPQPNPESATVITFTTRVRDETGVAGVRLVWTLDGAAQVDLQMHDDGAHGDGVAGDGVWGVRHGPLPEGSRVTYRARATDTDGLSYRYPGQNSFKVLPPFVKTAAILFVADAGGNSTPSDTTWFRSYYTNALDALGYRYDTWDTALRGEAGSAIFNQYTRGAVIWAVPYRATSRPADRQHRPVAGVPGCGRQTLHQRPEHRPQPLLLRQRRRLPQRLSARDLPARRHRAVCPGRRGRRSHRRRLGAEHLGRRRRQRSILQGRDRPHRPGPGRLHLPGRRQRHAGRTDPAGRGSGGQPTGRRARMLPQPDGSTPEASAAAAPAGNVGSGTAGLRVDTGTYKVVYFAFGFEAINSVADRNAVMERVLNWLAVRQSTKLCLPLVFAAQPPAADSFWADHYLLESGECTIIHWSVTNVEEVYLNNSGVVGQGTMQVCPTTTTTYVLRVVRTSGEMQEYRLTIVVEDGDLTPTPTPVPAVPATPTRRPTPTAEPSPTAMPEPTKAPEPTALPEPAPAPLLVLYEFEDDFAASGTVLDRSGNGHDAQVTGAVAKATGISGGQGISFTGNGYVQAASNPAAGKSDVTFSLWFKTEHPEENYKLASGAWWNWGPGSGWIMATHGPEFWSDDGNSLYLPDQPNNENKFAVSEWIHEVVTYDGSRIKEYTNGQLINDWSTTGAAMGRATRWRSALGRCSPVTISRAAWTSLRSTAGA